MKHFLIAAAAAIAFTAGNSVEAQTVLPDPDGCVSVTSLPARNSSTDNWSPEYRATNNCPERITIIWRFNYGLAYEGTISCSGGHATNIFPGGSYVLGAGPLPKGITSRISYCSEYWDEDHQELTGYMGCYASNKPVCPALR